MSIDWAVRTQGEPYTLSAVIQEELRQATGLPVSKVRTMAEVVELSAARQRFNMLLMTVFGGMALALGGVLIGIAAAWALAKLIESLLFGVKARDPLVFIAVPLTLALVALVAVWVPALRASRVTPIDSLR